MRESERESFGRRVKSELGVACSDEGFRSSGSQGSGYRVQEFGFRVMTLPGLGKCPKPGISDFGQHHSRPVSGSQGSGGKVPKYPKSGIEG